MPHARSSRPRAPRTVVPLIVSLGPLLTALTLSALGYALFRTQAGAGPAVQGPVAGISAPLEYTIVLGLAGALVSLLMAMLGLTLYGRSQKGARAAERAIEEAAEGAEAITAVAQRIAEQGARRDMAADEWGRRQREALALLAALDGKRAALQRAAGDIWAGLSQPGAPLDASTALRLARESAVAAGALGSNLDELRAVMAASRARAEAIETLDDALVEDLITVERLAQETYAMLNRASDGGGVSGGAPATGPLVGRRAAPGAPARVAPTTAVQTAINPAMRSAEPPRADTRPEKAMPPRPPSGGERASRMDSGRAWPPPPGERPQREQESGSTGVRPIAPQERWPFRPEDARRPQAKPDDSSARPQGPRSRDDSSSRWLND